jgi:NAD(P)-dependent dehydrogenase (short-subunit alcohol dehydrogenase family)
MTLLQGKRALVFGGGGSIGGATAGLFAAQGAAVFLAGRSGESIERVAKSIRAAGGAAETRVLDAESPDQVAAFVESVARGGPIDIAFNAVGPRVGAYRNGLPAAELPVEAFMTPLETLVKAMFVIAQAAARQMIGQGCGVIIGVTGSPARGHVAGATAIGAAFGAIETFLENLAFEVGPAGVRAVCVRTTANIDSRTIQDTMETLEARFGGSREESIARLSAGNFLRRAASVEDTARAVAFAASDDARMLTGTVLNASAGAALD